MYVSSTKSKNVALLLSTLTFALAAAAQAGAGPQTASIRITDQTGASIRGARVALVSGSGDIVSSSTSDAEGRVLGGEPCRIVLPKDVAPGETAAVSGRIPAPRVPGAYHLHLDAVKEACFWFREKGSPVPAVPFTVI